MELVVAPVVEHSPDFAVAVEVGAHLRQDETTVVAMDTAWVVRDEVG